MQPSTPFQPLVSLTHVFDIQAPFFAFPLKVEFFSFCFSSCSNASYSTSLAANSAVTYALFTATTDLAEYDLLREECLLECVTEEL